VFQIFRFTQTPTYVLDTFGIYSASNFKTFIPNQNWRKKLKQIDERNRQLHCTGPITATPSRSLTVKFLNISSRNNADSGIIIIDYFASFKLWKCQTGIPAVNNQ
jgi:hypothetical protein